MQSYHLFNKEVSQTMNETELVERCGKGDNLARKQLYERYAGQLMLPFVFVIQVIGKWHRMSYMMDF